MTLGAKGIICLCKWEKRLIVIIYAFQEAGDNSVSCIVLKFLVLYHSVNSIKNGIIASTDQIKFRKENGISKVSRLDERTLNLIYYIILNESLLVNYASQERHFRWKEK